MEVWPEVVTAAASVMALIISISSLTRRARLSRRLALELEMLDLAPAGQVAVRLQAMIEETSDRLHLDWSRKRGFFRYVLLMLCGFLTVFPLAQFADARSAGGIIACAALGLTLALWGIVGLTRSEYQRSFDHQRFHKPTSRTL